jgi:hypothetical protein
VRWRRERRSALCASRVGKSRREDRRRGGLFSLTLDGGVGDLSHDRRGDGKTEGRIKERRF